MLRLSKRAQAYALVASVVGAGLAVQTLRQQWSADVWQHAASIRAFEGHPFDPNHPLSVGLIDDPYFLNPWGMIWGLFSRLTGLDAFSTLVASGIVNLLLIGAGIYRLTTRVSSARLAPSVALVSVLLLWGPVPWRWSGYPNLNSIGFGLPYPSFLAFGLFLFGIVSVIDMGRHPNRRHGLALFACVTLTVLCHLLTGAALILSAVVVASVHGGDLATRMRHVGMVAAVIVAAVGLALLWPYGHLWDLVDAPAAFDTINRSVNRNLLPGAACALLAAPFVLTKLEPHSAAPLRALFAANMAIAAVGFLGGPTSAGRFLPFALLAVQISFAGVVAKELGSPPNRRAFVRLAAALVLAVGLVGARGALPRIAPSQLLPAYLQEDDRLRRASARAAVVPDVTIDDPVAIASGVDARLLVANGIRVVAPPYPVATLSAGEVERRMEDSGRFLTASPEDQRSIVTRYQVDVIVVPAGTARALALGRLIGSSPRMWVVDVSTLR